MLTVAVMALALLGLAISSYFTAVAYRWATPDIAWIPSVCRLTEDTCASVVHTPRARVFGLPNSVLGQAYYLWLLVAVPGGLLAVSPWRELTLLAAGATVVLGVYLTYSLLCITRVHCPLCYGSHVLNVVLAVLLWLGW